MLILLIPAWLFVGAVFFLNELGYWLLISWWRKPRPARRPPPPASGNITASIIVLNWNGEDLLAEFLPSVVDAVQHDGGQHEIIVVDNGSTDRSVDVLKERFPTVKVVPLEENWFFSGGNNAGAKTATNDVLVFLNNDMKVEKDFLRPLMEPFSADADVFAVTCQIFLGDPTKRREETGKTRAVWRLGAIEYRHDTPTEDDDRNRHVPVFWLGGGSSAIDRRKFLELGGFDTLMDPFYVEDSDLSYQAWKRGWKVLFCPASKVLHKHRGTSSRLWKPEYVERIIRRNRLLFIWKNLTDLSLTWQHFWRLPYLLWRMSWKVGASETAKTYGMAMARLPEALWKRNRCRVWYRRTDQEVFRIANSTFEYNQRFFPLQPLRRTDRLRILFVCAYLPSPLHAGGARIRQLIQRMSKQHEVSLLSFIDSDEERRFIPELETLCRKVVVVDRKATHNGTNHWRMLPEAIDVEFGDSKFGEALVRMLTEDDYDVVECEYIQVAHQLPQVHREATVLVDHEVQHAAILQQIKMERSYRRKIALRLRWLQWLDAEIHLARKFDRVVAVTEEDAFSLQRFDRKLPIDVITLGVDVDYFRPDFIKEEPGVLALVGYFRHTPNVDAALFLAEEIVPRVRSKFGPVRLYLIGSNPPPDLRKIESDQIVVTGWVDDLRPYLGRCSVFVAPIRLGVGVRGKILEAWAMGKAVVATPLACAGLHARHGETALLAETAEQFSESIVQVLRNDSLRRRLGENGRTAVEKHFSWDAIVAKHLDTMYSSIRQREAGIRD